MVNFLIIGIIGIILCVIGLIRSGEPFTIVLAVIIALFGLVVYWIDISIQTNDTEIWSGKITDVRHIEEYDTVETYTTTSTDANGNTTIQTHTRTVHHDAENIVTTSDNGDNYVDFGIINGKRKEFNDSYPNTTEELAKYYKIGLPTSSTHYYENKIQASSSIFKHPEINKDEFKLPEYPEEAAEPFKINRLIGEFPNHAVNSKYLDELNTYMNKMIPDPEKAGKKRSWKQCNLIFVNLGNQPIEAAMALEDSWEGGNKNDFIVTLGTTSTDHIDWVYPITWSESEDCKMAVTNALKDKSLLDTTQLLKTTAEIVIAKFERKQFADFSYLTVYVSKTATIVYAVITAILSIVAVVIVPLGRMRLNSYDSEYWY